MNLSLNELEALAKKAARGAGGAWGLAEDAAKATRWLCEQGVDGTTALAALLITRDGTRAVDWVPGIGAVWTAPGGTLCPVATGAALSDHAERLRADARVQIGQIAQPLLLAPFASLIARYLETTVTLRWDETVATIDGQGLSLTGARTTARTDAVAVTTGEAMGPAQPQESRAEAPPDSVATLTRLAQRTYAPATEMSRLTGAGAGLSDND